MKVIITGGAGFLGLQLAQRLTALGSLAGPSGKPEKIDELLRRPAELAVRPKSVLAAESAAAGTQLWLRFEGLSTGLAAALERHLFRLHRREVAERRRPR